MSTKRANIMAEFKAKQTLLRQEFSKANKPKKITRGFDAERPKRGKTYDHYQAYKNKLDNGMIDKFNTRDITYFFRDIANENGSRYVISNITKDMKSFKVCIERGYSIEELLAMIEFLFTSGQTYLDIKTIQPTILMSKWCNTIYNDTQLWLNDEYDPNKRYNNKKSKVSNREWTESVDDENATIGDWGY